jgi:endonuclease/exonuclease/phosphatase family metal-dependent hydrolase
MSTRMREVETARTSASVSSETKQLVFHDSHRATAPARKKSRSKRILIAATCIAVLTYAASIRRPAGPDAGVAMHVPTSRSDDGNDTLRIGTFNIHGGRGADGEFDLDRIAATLRGLDFAGLNEVRAEILADDQAATLGQSLGMPWQFAPTEVRWLRSQFGNGFLSNLPVGSWQRIPIARRYGKSFRNAVLVGAEHAGKPVNIVVTHIDRSDDRERAEQLRTVGDLFLSLATPAILLGDLNTDASEPALQRLLESEGVRDPLRDKLGDDAPRRIDWILVRGLETVDAGLVNNGASDHPHVWAELAWPAE